MSNKTANEYSDQETARRRDAVIKRMIATPPKLHSEMKIGKRSGKQDSESRRLKRKKPKSKY